MAYRNDFYNVHNIIGYTGDIRGLPTIYFQHANSFGRITQAHVLPYNIGRQKVHYHPGYRVNNEYRGGKLVAVETTDGRRDFHTSRNPFIPRRLFGPGDILDAATAIFRFQELKTRYDDDVMAQNDLHEAMQEELAMAFALNQPGARFAANTGTLKAAMIIDSAPSNPINLRRAN